MRKILFVYGKDRTEYLEQKKTNAFPDNILYGFNYLKKNPNIDCAYIKKKNKFIEIIDHAISRVLFRKYKISFNLFYILFNLKKIKQVDEIFAINDSVALPILLLKSFNFIHAKVYYLSIGLAHQLSIDSWQMKFIKKISKSANSILVFSESEKKQFGRFMPRRAIHHLVFGIDTSFFHPIKTKKKNLFLAIGVDPERDYETLCFAWKKIEELIFRKKIQLLILVDKKMATKLKTICEKTKIRNVKIDNIKKYNFGEIKKIYSRMIAGVIPVKNVARSAGQTAVLSMLSMNRPVVVSRNIWQNDYSFLKKHVTVVKPENVDDLANAIIKTISSPMKDKKNIHDIIRDKFNSYIMFQSISQILRL